MKVQWLLSRLPHKYDWIYEHPATANALMMMVLSSSHCHIFVAWPFPCSTFFLWSNRLLQIYEHTLGEHPSMARAMWQMCEAAQNFKSHDHIFELHEKALHMFECNSGREHCDVAQAFMIVSAEYKHQGNVIKASSSQGKHKKLSTRCWVFCTSTHHVPVFV